MRDKKRSESDKGVCCQCGGKFQRSRIWVHLKHCDCRMADVGLVHGRFDNSPTAFFIMVTNEVDDALWVALEAHVTATLADLDQQIAQLLFARAEENAEFLFPEEIGRRNGWKNRDDGFFEGPLDKAIRPGDRFHYHVDGPDPVLLDIRVVEEVGTSFLHRPIDVVAHSVAQQPREMIM